MSGSDISTTTTSAHSEANSNFSLDMTDVGAHTKGSGDARPSDIQILISQYDFMKRALGVQGERGSWNG